MSEDLSTHDCPLHPRQHDKNNKCTKIHATKRSHRPGTKSCFPRTVIAYRLVRPASTANSAPGGTAGDVSVRSDHARRQCRGAPWNVAPPAGVAQSRGRGRLMWRPCGWRRRPPGRRHGRCRPPTASARTDGTRGHGVSEHGTKGTGSQPRLPAN